MFRIVCLREQREAAAQERKEEREKARSASVRRATSAVPMGSGPRSPLTLQSIVSAHLYEREVSSWQLSEMGYPQCVVSGVVDIERSVEAAEQQYHESRLTDPYTNYLPTTWVWRGHGYSAKPNDCGMCAHRRALRDMQKKGLFATWQCQNCHVKLEGTYESDYMTKFSQHSWLVTPPSTTPPTPSGRCQGTNHQAFRSRHVWKVASEGWDGDTVSALPPSCNVHGIGPALCAFQGVPERLKIALASLGPPSQGHTFE